MQPISRGLLIAVVVVGAIIIALLIATSVFCIFRLYQRRVRARTQQLPLQNKRSLSLGR